MRITPGSEPQALAFTQVEPETSAGLKTCIHTKNCLDGKVRKGENGGVVRIQGNNGQSKEHREAEGENDRAGLESSC